MILPFCLACMVVGLLVAGYAVGFRKGAEYERTLNAFRRGSAWGKKGEPERPLSQTIRWLPPRRRG